ncbi:rhodoquinone biosynthesis methyltransferase RquA [Uliginosibacterium gangwonense]|uniref:rhodoquinone biosynthesis methyltransferase RquA n=1 Tax=Uliginosibacterium gangwonense TaxID=392736 RepID=UPI00035D3016|nr:rhodoquinone biosynthesis methyltransferase RquA [Uliginosibacterium gangwonense]
MADTTYEATEPQSQQCEALPPIRNLNANNELPSYMSEVYDWAYVDPQKVDWLDRNIVVKTLLFGNDQRLMRRYLERIRPGTRVWQVAHVYGDLVSKVAQRVGAKGSFHLTDITPAQIAHAQRKIGHLPWARVIRHDASHFQNDGKPYDLVCSFFLLHEVPEEWKQAVVNNMLAQVVPDGEVIFVDYHKPAWWQPIGYILRVVNHLLEPFAKALWEREISSYADNADQYNWDKRCIFGGVYQIVRVTRKA